MHLICLSLNRLIRRSRFLIVFTALVVAHAAAANEPAPPNIVVILADDMGYGEVQHLNPKRGKIATPHLDRLAQHGLVFTDAHSGSSVCTPTRYGLLTGRYAWRTRLQSNVLQGGESLIADDRLTVAKMLKGRGYHTAIVGKWHLGMLFDGKKQTLEVSIGSAVTHGPIDRGGFDEFYGFHHAGQMNLWIENDRVAAHIEPIEMLPRLTAKAVEFIRGRKGKDKPFFLYVPWNSPHGPVVPTELWKGKSGLNAHADFVMQTDHSYGQVIQALKDNGLFENTLVICGSDNGTSAGSANIAQLNKMGHYPSADLRGSKADIWDGGHRVPFIVSWPAAIKTARRTDALVCLTDLLATAAELTDYPLPDNAGEDSISFAHVLRGDADRETHTRTSVIHHSISGYFAIRQNNWKLICCPGSGGWSKPRTTIAARLAREKGLTMVQLYDMDADRSERKNLARKGTGQVTALRRLLDQQIAQGRSTPGAPQANDAAIVVDKWKAVARHGDKTKPKSKSK